MGVPGKRNRDPSPSCSLPGGVDEDGRESWRCAVFRCMVDVTVTIKFKVASAHQRAVLSLNLASTWGYMKDPCALSFIRDRDKDSSKRNSRDS